MESQFKQIPDPDSGWQQISSFALTFDCYEYCGSYENCKRIVEEKKHDTLNNLRTCLFFEVTKWNWDEKVPAGNEMDYIKYLLETIKEKSFSEIEEPIPLLEAATS